MKALSIAWKTFLEQLRDLKNLALAVSIPAGFMVLFALPYAGGLPTYKVLVDDADAGASRPGGAPLRAGAELSKGFAELRYEDKKPMLELKKAGRVEAETALKSGTAATLLLTIPADFSARVVSQGGEAVRALLVEGDPSSANFVSARWIVEESIEATVARLQGRPPAARPQSRLLGDGVARTEFDYVAPGVIIFAILLLVAQTAMLVVSELQSGTLQRYQLTGAGTAALFSGISASQMVVAAIQVPLMTGVAMAMGFHASLANLPAAMLVSMALSLSAVGLGLLVSCVARTPVEASNLAAGVLLPVTFLSGAFFPVPELSFFTLFDRPMGPLDLLSAKHAFNALRQLLLYGNSLGAVGFELAATLLLSAVYLGLGIAIFRRTRMRATLI